MRGQPARLETSTSTTFAACLLMPADLVKQEVAAYGGSPLVDWQVSELASTFEVSEQAMTIRLSALGLL